VKAIKIKTTFYKSILSATTLVTIILFSAIAAKAQIEISNFNGYTYYTEENGLASTYITDIEEDKYGFLWIGTANGISRYDGNQFTNFFDYSNDSLTRKIGFVNALIMDRSGDHLWIACNDGILFTSTDTIKFRMIEAFFPSVNISTANTNKLLLEHENKLWAVNNESGLHCYDLKNKKHDQFIFKDAQTNASSKLNRLQCIVIDPVDSNVFWIGSLAGLIQFNVSTHDYKIFVYENTPEQAQNNIRRIHASETEVFLGTWTKGLLIFNKKTAQFRQPLSEKFPNSHLLMLDIFKDQGNTMWITSSDGIIHYDTKTKSVISVKEHNLASGLFRGVTFIDSRGIIWFGFGKGLFKYDPLDTPDKFIALEKRNEIQNSLIVREIIRSNDDVYVAGQYSSGLYKISMVDGSFEVIKIPIFDYPEKAGYNIMDMVEMDDGNILLISVDKIAIYNPETQKAMLSPLQIDHPNPSLQTVVKDKNNRYWIGSRAGGLFLLDFDRNTVRTFKDEFNVFQNGNHVWINSLFIDSKNKLWIGKGSTSAMDLDDLTLHLINPENQNNIKTYKDVDEFYEDKSGRVWMAGGSKGFGFTNFENFEKGVSHQVDGYFSGVYPLNDSLLWLIGKTLGTFNTNTFTFQQINLNSNQDKNQVIGPVIPYKDEEFLIGCYNGILIYNYSKQNTNPEKPIPYISRIESKGKTLYAGNSLTRHNFNLKQGTEYLTIALSSLSFHFSDQISYQYRLAGDWRALGPDREINLTSLSYGKYNLQIRAINNQGISSEKPGEFLITIPAPWWFRWWAYLIYIGIAVLLADRFYRFQLSKKLAVAESVKLKEINNLRNSFYTNITHEFRTPLTVILGMVDSLKSVFESKKLDSAGHSIEMIERNGKNLLRLVNEMLDLSKLESGKAELKLIQADVIPFIKYLSESFYSLASGKQINLTVYTEVDELVMDFDPNKLTAIISNLLSNAIKFTQNDGEIIVHINQAIKNKSDGKFLILKIKDNGQGIEAEELTHIFNRFYQVDHVSSKPGEGTGIGLTLTREFVELMNGTITVKSKPDKGTEFTIQLPVYNKAELTVNVPKLLEPNLFLEEEEPGQIQKDSDENVALPLALIIEDNADVAHYLETCLIGKYQTIYASSGDTGIETAFEKVPDIIICDIMMPVKDGFEVCRELKSDQCTDHIPIIILTAKVALKDKLTGLSCGADAYLTKPFVKAELLTRLDQLVLSRKKLLQKINNDTLGKILKTQTEDPETKFLQKIITIIHDEISNHSFGSSFHLARKMHLSESQIYRKLKAITGKSTAVFIRSVRLQKAKELLQTTDKSISEIAYEVGFNDPSWFSRAFREEFGYAPSDLSK